MTFFIDRYTQDIFFTVEYDWFHSVLCLFNSDSL